jgi:addiction module HigA family antidote
MRNGMRPIHPGEVLREDFLVPLSLSASALARALRVPPNRVTGLLNETRAVTADTALRLARFFNTSAEFWLNLQSTYDLRSEEIRSAKDIAREVSRYRQSQAAEA